MNPTDKVCIGDFDPKMLDIFEEYKAIIKKKLPKSEVILFGSNAVPMKGKIHEVDILVIVEDQYAALPLLRPSFPQVEEFEGRVYMHARKGPVHIEVHLVSKRHEKINRVLGMLERFKTDKKLRLELEKLKESCHGKTMSEYRAKKTEFFKKHKMI